MFDVESVIYNLGLGNFRPTSDTPAFKTIPEITLQTQHATSHYV